LFDGSKYVGKFRDGENISVQNNKAADQSSPQSEGMGAAFGFFVLFGIGCIVWARLFAFPILVRRQLSKIPNFKPTLEWINARNGNALALDISQNKLALIDAHGGSVVGFQQILAVEVCKNDISIIRTNRGSQLVGAAGGYALLGPMGLLIGAVTGSKRQTEKINKLSLKIYVADLLNPVREIIFYHGKPIDLGSVTYETISRRLDEWHGRLRVIVAGNAETP
jgi:hypothetical protein